MAFFFSNSSGSTESHLFASKIQGTGDPSANITLESKSCFHFDTASNVVCREMSKTILSQILKKNQIQLIKLIFQFFKFKTMQRLHRGNKLWS